MSFYIQREYDKDIVTDPLPIPPWLPPSIYHSEIRYILNDYCISMIQDTYQHASKEEYTHTREIGCTFKIGFIPLILKLQKPLIKVIGPSSHLDLLILAEILSNAIVMACVDYQHINDNYFPDVKQSFRNDFIERKAEEQQISLTNKAIYNMYSVNLNLKKPTYTD